MTFMAGAKSTGARVAMTVVVSMSSAMPFGDLADDVGCGRGDDEEVSPVGEGDVADFALRK